MRVAVERRPQRSLTAKGEAEVLTILLPVRDAQEHLPEALESLSAQAFGDFVCLALDDGSADASRCLLEAHARRDARFRVLHADAPLGVPGALNHLLARVETPLFARMDADDRAHPQRLRLQVEAARLRPEVELWAGGVETLGEASEGWRDYLAWCNAVTEEEDLLRHALTENPLPHPTWLGRVAALRNVGGYRDGPFPEDYDLALRLIAAGARLGKVPQALTAWRDHPARQTRTHPRCGADALLRLKAARLPALAACGRMPWLKEKPLAVWGAGKTGRIAASALREAGMAPACVVDPERGGQKLDGFEALGVEASPPGRHLLLVAVRPRRLRAELARRFENEGRRFGRDFVWFW